MNTIEGIWSTTWARYVEPAHLAWTRRLLWAQYDAFSRHYHTLTHVDACLDILGTLWRNTGETHAAALALLWHDAVYVPGDKRNEELSARLLQSLRPVLTGDERIVDVACAAILATKHHDAVFEDNSVSAIVVDIDLSILGAAPDTYEIYTRQIRAEFHHVSDEAWRVGRGAFLAGMIERPKIFRTACGAERLERRAKENMARELRSLERKW
jgi:predicted metal-dependent HD superfamily phosphohydrolase